MQATKVAKTTGQLLFKRKLDPFTAFRSSFIYNRLMINENQFSASPVYDLWQLFQLWLGVVMNWEPLVFDETPTVSCKSYFYIFEESFNEAGFSNWGTLALNEAVNL